jgi:hypothetical protein
MELEESGRIKTSLSQCFMDLCQRDAARQGIDLGFRQAARAREAPSPGCDVMIAGVPESTPRPWARSR